MISIDPNTESERGNYKLLIGSIIPRPVAFVTTLAEDGTLNAAPYSYFSIVTANPPMISISVQRKEGLQKDTVRNAAYKKEFVVHISDVSYIHAINETAANLPPNQSEVKLAKLTPIESQIVSVPGIQEASIRMECLVDTILPFGGTDGTAACDMIVGRIVRFHIAEHLYDKGRIDAQELKPVSRLAGNNYALLGAQFSIERPE